jgi:hypothetical protein
MFIFNVLFIKIPGLLEDLYAIVWCKKYHNFRCVAKFNTVLFCFVFLQEAKTPALIESPLEIFPTAVKKIEEDDIW